jgi:hypothetical protein
MSNIPIALVVLAALLSLYVVALTWRPGRAGLRLRKMHRRRNRPAGSVGLPTQDARDADYSSKNTNDESRTARRP